MSKQQVPAPVERLKTMVVSKSNLGDPVNWSHHQFECLRELILQDTGVLLSTNTLKRLFGKISSSGSASKSTLNALSNYCGFNNYVSFLKSEGSLHAMDKHSSGQRGSSENGRYHGAGKVEPDPQASEHQDSKAKSDQENNEKVGAQWESQTGADPEKTAHPDDSSDNHSNSDALHSKGRRYSYKKKARSRLTSTIYMILASSIILLLIWGTVHEVSFRKAVREATITQVYDYGMVPFTQVYKYQFPSKILDSIYFRELDKNLIGLSTADSVFSWVHFVPGYRTVKFFARNKEIASDAYMVYSDGWLLIHPWGSVEPRKYIHLEAADGVMKVQRGDLLKHNIQLDDDGGYLHYFNMKDYPVDGKDFIFHTRVRNKLETGMKLCQDVIVEIECEQTLMVVHFTQEGCQKFAEITLGKDYYDGEHLDLLSLSRDFNLWQELTFAVSNGIFSIGDSTGVLIEKPLSETPGKLTGLHFSFRGIGELDYIHFTNNEGISLYTEEFNTAGGSGIRHSGRKTQ